MTDKIQCCATCGRWTHVSSGEDGTRWGYCAAEPTLTYVSHITGGVCDHCDQVLHESGPCIRLMVEPTTPDACEEWTPRRTP